MRTGWCAEVRNAPALALAAESAGIRMLTVHGRTREQKFSGRADWSILKAVKERISIPVIGNGDIKCADDAERMIRETGVDGVMIGRAGMGNPWLFGQVCARLAGRPAPPEPTVEERLDTVARHATIMVQRKGPFGLVEFRKHAVQYLRGFHSAKQLKGRLLNLRDLDEYLREIDAAKAEIHAMEAEALALEAAAAGTEAPAGAGNA